MMQRKKKQANTHNNKVETDIKIIYLLFPESTERWWISNFTLLLSIKYRYIYFSCSFCFADRMIWYDMWSDMILLDKKNNNHVFGGSKSKCLECGPVSKRDRQHPAIMVGNKTKYNLMLSNHFKSNISSREIYSLHHNSNVRQRSFHTYVRNLFAFRLQVFRWFICLLCNLKPNVFSLSSHHRAEFHSMKTGRISKRIIENMVE